MTPLKMKAAQVKRLQRNLQGKKKTREQTMPQSFLCGNCRSAMCSDCQQIAEEYQELYERQKHELSRLLHQVGEWQIKYQNAERRAQMFEEVAKAGIPAVIVAWMDKEIGQLLSVREAAE